MYLPRSEFEVEGMWTLGVGLELEPSLKLYFLNNSAYIKRNFLI